MGGGIISDDTDTLLSLSSLIVSIVIRNMIMSTIPDRMLVGVLRGRDRPRISG